MSLIPITSSKIEKKFYGIFRAATFVGISIALICILVDIYNYENINSYLLSLKKPGMTLSKGGVIIMIVPLIILLDKKYRIKAALRIETRKAEEEQLKKY